MKFLAVLAILVCGQLSAKSLEVKSDPLWQPASEEQLAQIPKDPTCEILDFSISESLEGYAIAMQLAVGTEINREAYAGALEGCVEQLTKGGQVIIAQKKGSLGHLPAVWILSEQKSEGTVSGTLHVATLMAFGKEGILTLSVGSGSKPIDDASPLVQSYLSRLSVAPAYPAGDITKEAPVNKDRLLGRVIGNVLMVVLLIGFPLGLMWFFSRSGRNSKKQTPDS